MISERQLWVRHSDEVLGTFLTMAGLENLMVTIKLAAAEQAIMELLVAVQSLTRDRDGGRTSVADRHRVSDQMVRRCRRPLAGMLDRIIACSYSSISDNR